jgi:hypothetical protein
MKAPSLLAVLCTVMACTGKADGDPPACDTTCPPDAPGDSSASETGHSTGDGSPGSTGSTESTGGTGSTESIGSTGSTESTESTEGTESTESTGSTGSPGSTESTEGSSSSGGMECEPALLMGPSYSAGTWQMVSLDPTTGVVSTLAPIDAVGFNQGNSAYDPATQRIHAIGLGGPAETPRVFTFDGLTGTTIASAETPGGSNIEVVNGSVIVALNQPSPGSWETATLDSATGIVTSLWPVGFAGGFYMDHGFDPLAAHVFQFGELGGTPHVLTFDATAANLGVQLSMQPYAGPFSVPTVNAAGEILGLVEGAGAWYDVARLDPMNGSIVVLQPAAVQLSGTHPGVTTFDPCADRMYTFTPDGVLTIDGTSGAVISLVPAGGGESVAFLEAVW